MELLGSTSFEENHYRISNCSSLVKRTPVRQTPHQFQPLFYLTDKQQCSSPRSIVVYLCHPSRHTYHQSRTTKAHLTWIEVLAQGNHITLYQSSFAAAPP